MSIIIIGNSLKKVELRDLNDSVYYKQQKIYTDSQYERSIDLKRAIEKKELLVLKKIEEKPTCSEDSSVTIATLDSNDNSDNNILLTKIEKLLEKLDVNKPENKKEKDSSSEILGRILERIENLEKKISSLDISTVKEEIKEVKDMVKNNKDTVEEVLFSKIEGIISKNEKYEQQDDKTNLKEDVYVPNIIVEDARTNVKLEVRKVESEDNISDSIKKLKELKSKS